MPTRLQLMVEDSTEGRMTIRFVEYNARLKERVQAIPGARWVGPTSGGPGFRIQKDMQTCTDLRKKFGDSIEFSPEILAWGAVAKAEAERLIALANSDSTAEDLGVLAAKLDGRMFWNKNTEQDELIWENFRPDQKVGVVYFNEAAHPAIFDEPGLGKTWQVIGGILQAGTEQGPNLVICPKISIESVWLEELNAFQDEPVYVAPEGKKQRERLLEEVALCLEEDIPFWLVVNFAMVSLREAKKGQGAVYHDHNTGRDLAVQFPFLFEVPWNNVIVDEAHMSGLPNPGSQFSRAMRHIHGQKRIAMTGTPMGGKPERLWGTLNWLEPKDFGSKTTWLKRWSVEKKFEVNGRNVVTYEGLKGKEEERFYREHSRYILRRKKEDVMKDLPPFQRNDVWVPMTPTQAKQYELMEQEATATIMRHEEETGRISMSNILATNMWLKQFANAYCELDQVGETWDDIQDEFIPKFKARPTADTNKLPALLELMQTIGVDDKTTGEQIVVFSQFRQMAELTHEWLNDHKIATALITGSVSKRATRQEVINDFQRGGVYQAVVFTTKAGGVSINLDRANTCAFLDETYDPDDQSQAADRTRRASRIHQVSIHTIRCHATIEEDIVKKLKKKQKINDILLDRYRQLKEAAGE